MADTRGSFIIRRQRKEARRHAEIVADRLRRLGPPADPEPVPTPEAVPVTTHTQRWCPETELNILLGPDLICPACGADTVLR